MSEDCDYGPPDMPEIPDGAFSDLVKLAYSWVQSIHDKIDHLKREHDDSRKELSAPSLLAEIRSEMRGLKYDNEMFHNALSTFQAIERDRTEGMIAEAVRRVLAERKNEHE